MNDQRYKFHCSPEGQKVWDKYYALNRIILVSLDLDFISDITYGVARMASNKGYLRESTEKFHDFLEQSKHETTEARSPLP